MTVLDLGATPPRSTLTNMNFSIATTVKLNLDKYADLTVMQLSIQLIPGSMPSVETKTLTRSSRSSAFNVFSRKQDQALLSNSRPYQQ